VLPQVFAHLTRSRDDNSLGLQLLAHRRPVCSDGRPMISLAFHAQSHEGNKARSADRVNIPAVRATCQFQQAPRFSAPKPAASRYHSHRYTSHPYRSYGYGANQSGSYYTPWGSASYHYSASSPYFPVYVPVYTPPVYGSYYWWYSW
jgi:hypothetical protein